MDPRVVKSYNKLFPSITIDTINGLTDGEVMMIFEDYFQYNPNNDLVITAMQKMRRDYPSITGYIAPHLSKLVRQPLLKRYNLQHVSNNPIIVEYWLIRGFNLEEAQNKVISFKNKLRKDRNNRVSPQTKEKYKCLDIDISNKSKLTQNDIIKIIDSIDPHFNKSSQIFKELCNNIEASGNFPTIASVTTFIRRITNKEGTPGASMMQKEFFIIRGWDEYTAKQKVSKFAKSCCIFSTDFYVKKGYSLEEAQKIVSTIQKENSQYSIDHWIKRGYSIEEAQEMIQAEIQLAKEQSFTNTIDYWIVRGNSLEEAIKKAKYHQAKMNELNPTQKEYWLVRNYTLSESLEKAKMFNPFSLQYWKTIYDTEEEAQNAKENYLYNHQRYNKELNAKLKTVSKIAAEFCLALKSRFPAHQIETVTSEFSIKDEVSKHLYFFDYADHTCKIIVEFNGNFWHSIPKVIERDNHKQILAENCGYKIFTITDNEYLNDKINAINNMEQQIKDYIKEF